MFNLSVPWWEFIVRGIVVYAVLLLLLKIGGRKQIGQLSPFDLVLLLILSNAVQNSMNAGDNSLIGGLISAVTLVIINWLMDVTTSRNRKFSEFIEGKPEVIVHNGKVYENILKQQNISHDELHAAIRKSGILELSDVHYAVLEATGGISVIAKKK